MKRNLNVEEEVAGVLKREKRSNIMKYLIVLMVFIFSGCSYMLPPKVEGGKIEMSIEKIEKIQPSKDSEELIIEIKNKEK